jgi:hypothetical protein
MMTLETFSEMYLIFQKNPNVSRFFVRLITSYASPYDDRKQKDRQK